MGSAKAAASRGRIAAATPSSAPVTNGRCARQASQLHAIAAVAGTCDIIELA